MHVLLSDQRIIIFPANRNRNRLAESSSVQIGIGIVCEVQNLQIGLGIVFVRWEIFVNYSRMPKIIFSVLFSATRPSGPSWSNSRDVRLMAPSHAIFFCVVGLVQSVPRPWTGGILISISSRALKTRMCSRVQS